MVSGYPIALSRHLLGCGASLNRANLESFLNEVLPVAEEAGVVLAMHPDDPPMAEFRGNPQIMVSTEVC